MLRRDFLAWLAAAALRPRASQGAVVDPKGWSTAHVLPAPDDATQWPAYREALARWRADEKRRIGYRDDLYLRPDFSWVPSSFACCFLMLCDEKFYDRRSGRYEVDAWIDAGLREFGGYDSVVLWHAYPRIGLDQRNQFDFYRDMPGGLEGVRKVSHAFQARGVKVYINYNPWDTGTRRESASDIDAVVAMVKAVDADGIFLDTMNQGSSEFRVKLDEARRGVVLESEGTLPSLKNIQDHHMSWAQDFEDSTVPGVLRDKWFERRHMQHQIKRWNRDHTGELHAAWMNGSGIMIWENVFGSWVGWSPRDRSLLRSMLPIQRRYAALFSGEGWTPLAAAGLPDVYASLWEQGAVRLWTVVNRAGEPRDGVVLTVPHASGARYFDLIRGRELRVAVSGGSVALRGTIRPRGIACFLAMPGSSLDRSFQTFLSGQAALDAHADFSTAFPPRDVVLRAAPKTIAAPMPAGMAEIGPVKCVMTVQYRIRETGFYTGQEYPYRRMFQQDQVKREVSLGRYAIDLAPVTNAQYAEFLQRSGYKPVHPENFLRHWKNGAPPVGTEEHPVVYVDLDDTRAYAAWAGKRLPTEEEWQYAAQGADGRRYPWGSEMRPHLCNAGESGTTTPVKAHPGGRSPFGCYDMCGNTWEWTESERSDGRTRFAILRGGSYFEARGSHWYMDGGPKPCDFAAKMLLMWPGLDRCATVGFRCAMDL
ncbi:MAG: SUMF1/EgtB/PvdO family nonheme iron enzyme [Bryobacteraceae bacterium]|nr:SUMF1/EgtB/PvdO family nonheme iron enzyme [Bryobacterales bacterium]NUN00938.1 SUMF1/EgtB/PvdO family nonheme iron enzyme [Bryobacteraceae bacterium]